LVCEGRILWEIGADVGGDEDVWDAAPERSDAFAQLEPVDSAQMDVRD
jgi:hypothetical protein